VVPALPGEHVQLGAVNLRRVHARNAFQGENMHSPSQSTVDLAVIGSGGAAMSAAINARLMGASVVMVERGTLGGTCVNIGCVPSKTLLAAAGARHGALNNPFPGAPTTAAGVVDFAALVEQKDELVGRLRQTKYADIATAYDFKVLHGVASFADPDTLLVDGVALPASAYLIATGAQPAVPDLPGLSEVDYLTSTTAMELDDLPTSLVVIGGGYVGLEQAQLFAHLGTKVSLIGRLAPGSEPELASALRKVFLDEGSAWWASGRPRSSVTAGRSWWSPRAGGACPGSGC